MLKLFKTHRWLQAYVAILLFLTLVMVSCGVSVDLGSEAAPSGDGSVGNQSADEGEGQGESEGDGEVDSGGAPQVPVNPNEVVTAGRFSWTDSDCDFEPPAGVATRCGWLTVPEDWNNPENTDTLRLHAGVVHNEETNPTSSPIVYLEGGPGGDALSLLSSSFPETWSLLAEQHDVVFYSQRGSAIAEPHLNCPEVEESQLESQQQANSADNEMRAGASAFASCVERLNDEGIRLDVFNSVQSAHDLEALRLSLFDEPWNVVGVSYGTRLAQTLMRLHPDGVRSVVLDAIVPNASAAFAEIPLHASRAFGEFFAACEGSTVCNEQWPNLEERYWAVVEAMDVNPLSYSAVNATDGSSFTLVSNGDDLVGLTFQALYSVDAMAALPELIEQLEQGDTTGLSIFGGLSLVQSAFFSEAMYYAVSCHEEIPFVTDQQWADGESGDPRVTKRMSSDGGLADDYRNNCLAFLAGMADPVEDQPVVSDIPALLLSGQFDPITPPKYGDAVQETLPNSTAFVLPNSGHGAIASDCGKELILQFLVAFDEVDGSCVANIPEPEWASDPAQGLDLVLKENVTTFLSNIDATVPASWSDQGSGIFYADGNLLHQTALVMQGTGGIGYELFVDQFLGLLAGGVQLVNQEPYVDALGREWQHQTADGAGFIFDGWGLDDDGNNLVIILQSVSADRQALLDELMPGVLSGTSGR